MRRIIYLTLVLLALLHQDFWWWDRPIVVLGFLPASLAYHALYCIVVAVVWWAVTVYAWPDDAGPREERSPVEGRR